METKVIKLVTIKVAERKLHNESEKALTFRVGARKKFLTFPKSQMYNFEKVVTWFPIAGGGRFSQRAFMFKIPLWLYKKKAIEIGRMKIDILVENTHIGCGDL